MFYLEYLNFNYKHFIRKREKKEDSKNLKVSYTVVHPALTFSCL